VVFFLWNHSDGSDWKGVLRGLLQDWRSFGGSLEGKISKLETRKLVKVDACKTEVSGRPEACGGPEAFDKEVRI
jgi:hypothetical protein